VAARLPGLDAQAATALALVELARVQSDQAARELGLGAEDLGAALARARKELRRSRRALAGSGWCERAERLISDRLDGELAPFATRSLDAHLRNCPRCVEHERRLVQATDALVAGVSPAAPAPEPVALPAPVPAAIPKPIAVDPPPSVAVAPMPRRGSRELAAATGWNVLLAVAILLALASLALALAGALGAHP